jgi:imidazolonepropionase-like amidohydrolase
MPSQRWALPTTLLPDGDERDLWVVDGRLTSRPPAAAERLPGRFTLPGLVDAHAHISLGAGQVPLDLKATAEALGRLPGMGVLAIRDVGSPDDLVLDLVPATAHPTIEAAGQWLAPEGRYYARLHRPVAPDDVVAAALAQVRAGARWIKVVADWTEAGLSYEPSLLERLVDAVHDAGARVAAHTQGPDVSDIIAAGVDSLEHGCGLRSTDLDVLAASGIAWTPTLSALSGPMPADAAPERVARRQGWLDNSRALLASAAERGVTILAGTDTAGPLSDEIALLIDFGLTPAQALRAATTDARAYLGLPALDGGAAADVVTFEADPREDPSVLADPAAVLLRGTRIR